MEWYYRFWYYRYFTMPRNFWGKKISNSYTTEDKSLVLAKPNQRKRSKHPNRTVNPQAFLKTVINGNIVHRIFYTIYRALKLPYCSALSTTTYVPSHALLSQQKLCTYVHTYIRINRASYVCIFLHAYIFHTCMHAYMCTCIHKTIHA